VPVMERLAELDVLAQIHPGLSWRPEMAAAFRRLSALLEDDVWRDALQDESPASVRFALWLAPLAEEVREAVMARLKVRKSTREEVEGAVQLARQLQERPAGVRPSQVEKTVRPFEQRPRIQLAARAVLGDDPAGELLDRYRVEWRHVETVLDGNDLREMGLDPGPQYAVLLDRLLAARLDGEVSTEGEERALLEKLVEEEAVG
ncbi:MAG: hypothetical protein R3248_13210, partial [Candidatus Promineifilaceae bacterium]|nr:hypothetical protein [Candidatus Promineifilaceae bacterium]